MLNYLLFFFSKLPYLEGHQAILKKEIPGFHNTCICPKGHCHKSIYSCAVILLRSTVPVENKARAQQWKALQLLSNAFSKERFCHTICGLGNSNESRLVVKACL